MFVKKAAAFQKHSKSMADTASALAKSGGVTDKKMADDLIRTAGKVEHTHKHKHTHTHTHSKVLKSSVARMLSVIRFKMLSKSVYYIHLWVAF